MLKEIDEDIADEELEEIILEVCRCRYFIISFKLISPA